MGESGVNGYETADRAVHRRRGEEDDLRAQVVAAPQALRTASTRHARLKRNQLADPASVDPVADVNHRPGGLVTDDHRIAYHIVADTTVLVVVDIGTADPDCSDFDQDLTGARFRDRPILDPNIVRSVQHGTGV